MSVISVQKGFSFPIAVLSSAAQRLLGALQDETIGAPVVSHLSAAFVADFSTQIALVAQLGADQSGAIGSVGALVQSQAEARAGLLHLTSVARQAARLAFRGQTTLLRGEFQVGADFQDLPRVLERGRKLLAACQRSAVDLAPHGWSAAGTEALGRSVEGLDTLSRQRELEADGKQGVTARRIAAANTLYRQCLTVQNVARLVYAGARDAADPAAVAGRARFLLGEFPAAAARSLAKTSAGAPVGTPEGATARPPGVEAIPEAAAVNAPAPSAAA